MTCGAPYTGGRRRRTARRGKKQRGAGYGFGGALNTNGPVWNSVSDANFVDSATGGAIPNDPPKVGGRRKSRKASKKSRKSRRKSMRGGATGVSATAPYAGFAGTGVNGMADFPAGYQPGNRF